AARLPDIRKLDADGPTLADGASQPQARAPRLAVENQDLVAASRKPVMVRELRRDADAQPLVDGRRFPRGDAEDRHERAEIARAERRGLFRRARGGPGRRAHEKHRRRRRTTCRDAPDHRMRLSTIMTS